MKNNKKNILRNVLAIFVSLILLGLNFVLIHNSDVFGSPFFFVLGILGELILIIVIGYNLIRALKVPFLVLFSILNSSWQGIEGNKYIKKLNKKWRPFFAWTQARLDATSPTGLILSVGMVVSAVFLSVFAGLIQDVIFHDPLTQFDVRVVNLVPAIRTPLQTEIFRFVTFLANYQAITLLTILAVGILWFSKKRLAAELMLLVVAVEEITVYVVKHIVGRVRPERYLSLISEDKFSFPSGHVMAATLIYGFLFYLIFRSFRSAAARLALVISYLILVIMIALSRVYLGVHFPSDVLASMMLGASILTLFITFIEIATRFELWQQNKDSFSDRYLVFVPIILVVFSLLFSSSQIKIHTVQASTQTTTIAQIDEETVKKFPLYSETLTSSRMEPISFVYIGSKSEIQNLFLSHGWFQADPSTIDNTLRAIAVGFQGRQYLTAPVTPSYLAAKPEDLAFQHPTSSGTLRQRHHTRLWRTNFRLSDGREVWVATASFDDRVEFSGPARILPTHHIDPNIDAERSYIIESLGLKNVDLLPVTDPQIGKNAAGDSFFTDGKAALIYLR